MDDETRDHTALDDHARSVYLQEIIQQASAGVLAAQATFHSALGSQSAGALFHNARGVANASAMVSKLLWPSSPRRGEGEDAAQFQRRKALAQVRGPELRELLEVAEDSPLQNRRVRDAVEHFDERLDRRLSSPDRNIMRDSVGPPNMIHFAEATEPFYLNHYDPASTIFTILGDEVNLHEMHAHLSRLLEAAMGAMQDIEHRRYSFPTEGPRGSRFADSGTTPK
ncbi:hypothetical protein [Calidifontibacter terrae]